MRSVSQGLINSVNAGGRAFVKAYVEYADGTNEWLTDNDFMQGSLSIQSGTSSSGSFDIGGAVIGSFAFNLNNWDLKFENRTFAGAIIVPYVGYEIKDFTLELVTELEEIFTTETGDNLVVELASQEGIEWVRLGTYYFVDHKSVGNVIRCDTYDAMKLFDENMLSDNNLNYPLAAWQVAQAIATHNGIPLATTRFPGSTILLETAPDNDMTERQALAYIGQMCGCYARINSDGRLAFEWYGDPEATISTRFDHDIDTEDINITGVRVTYGDDNDTYLHGQEGYVLSISGNPWVTENNYAEVAANVAQNVVGMTFRPGSMNVLSTPQYESGDVVRAYDDKGVQIVFLITNLTFTFSLRESLSCDAETRDKRDLRSSVSSVYAERVKEYARGELTAYDMQYMELSRLMSMSMGMFETREYDDTGGFVLYMHNKPNLSESDTVWKKTADAFAVSTNYNTPNPTWNAGITSDGKALVNILSAIGITADWVQTGLLTDARGYNQWNLDTGELRLNAGTKVGTGNDTLNTMLTTINVTAEGLSTEVSDRQTAVSDEAQARINGDNTEKDRAEGVERGLSSRIDQSAHTISLSVSGTAGKSGTAYAGITITLKDKNGNPISTPTEGKVYISGETVFQSQLSTSNPTTTIINGDNITTGTIKDANSNTVFNLSTGTLTMKKGSITLGDASDPKFMVTNAGALTAKSGNIAGWAIGADRLAKALNPTASTVGYRVDILAPTTPTANTQAFLVRQADATSGTASWSKTLFVVKYDGSITADGGGRIGAWTLGKGTTGALSNGMTSLSDTTNNGVWIGSDGIALGKGNFKVTNAGAITAVGGGKIGAWTLGTGDGTGNTGALYFNRNALSINKSGVYIGADGIAVGGTTSGVNAYFEAKSNSNAVYINQLFFRDASGTPTSWGFNRDSNGRIATGCAIKTNHENTGENNSLGGITYANIPQYNGESDRRIKKNIQALSPDKALENILAFKPVTFEYKQRADYTETFDELWAPTGTHHGLIAQDSVREDWDLVYDSVGHIKDMKAIRYTEIIADLISVCQTLLKRVDALEAKQ